MVSSARAMFLLAAAGAALLCFSAPSWPWAWVTLEVNLYTFIPLLAGARGSGEVESAIKYFLVQEVGGFFLVLGMGCWHCGVKGHFLTPLLLGGLLVKAGLAPCHFWVPGVFKSASWANVFLLSTLQKMAPLALLSIAGPPTAMYWVGGVSALVGGVGGFFQTHPKLILSYSSISQMGWVGVCLGCGPTPASGYFLAYVTSLAVALSFLKWRGVHPTSVNSPRCTPSLSVLIMVMLGGFPPFPLFWGKVVALWAVWPVAPVFTAPLIISAAVSMSFYLKLGLKSILRLTGGRAALMWRTRACPGMVACIIAGVFAGVCVWLSVESHPLKLCALILAYSVGCASVMVFCGSNYYGLMVFLVYSGAILVVFTFASVCAPAPSFSSGGCAPVALTAAAAGALIMAEHGCLSETGASGVGISPLMSGGGLWGVVALGGFLFVIMVVCTKLSVRGAGALTFKP